MPKKKLLTAVCIVLISNMSFAQNYDSANQKADSLLNEFLKISNIPGLSAAVSIDDKIIYVGSFGFSDVDKKTPVNDLTMFRTGSINKLFTAALTVKLIEDGIIESNSSVTKYINNLPISYQNITIAGLASHTAGIRHYTRDEIMSTNTVEYSRLEDALSIFINDSLISKPGQKYSYSSYGYILLGAALENASGKKFNDLMKEYILLPSGIEDTSPEITDSPNKNSALFYYPSKENAFIPANGDNFSYKWPAAGYLSTATDLVKFGSALMAGKITDIKMLSLLFDTQSTEDGKNTNCGYGFRTGTDNNGRQVVHHGGEAAGARAFVLIYPEEKLTVALVSNVFRAPLFEGEAETIAGYFLKDYSHENNFPIGILKFTSTYDDKQVKGEINLEGGMVTGLTNQELPIADIVQDGDKIRIIALSPSGIINIWLKEENMKYSGKWGYDKETTEIIFE